MRLNKLWFNERWKRINREGKWDVMPLMVIIGLMGMSGVLVWWGYRMGMNQSERLSAETKQHLLDVTYGFREYKKHSLDLSNVYSGTKPLALNYLYSLKQGIMQGAEVKLRLRGLVTGWGKSGDREFRILLKHRTDQFSNSIVPDEYEEAVVVEKRGTHGMERPIRLDEVNVGDDIELMMDLDLLTAFERVTKIVVYRD
jgi:hypothetical protein